MITIGILLMIIILYLVFIKEKSAIGCENASITYLNCDPYKNPVLKDTKYKEGDTLEDIKRKLKNVFSSYERDIIWRRCLILAFIATLIIYFVNRYNI